jgi:hypothetical protein
VNTEREETTSKITSRSADTVSEMNTQGPMQEKPEKPGSLQPTMILTIRKNDVVFGKGKVSSAHPGNVLFREMCGDVKENFVGARG